MPAATVTVCLFSALPQMPDSGTMTSLAASLWPTELIIIYCSRLLGVIGSESRCMHAFSGRGGPSLEGHPQDPVTGVIQGERPQMTAATVTVCSVSALPLLPASGTVTSLAASLWPTVLIIIYCSRLLGVVGSGSRCMLPSQDVESSTACLRHCDVLGCFLVAYCTNYHILFQSNWRRRQRVTLHACLLRTWRAIPGGTPARPSYWCQPG